MKIKPDDPRLTAYALGELNASERAVLDAALKQAPECRKEIDEIRQLAAELERELASETAVDLTPAQRQALLATAPRRRGLLARLKNAVRLDLDWAAWKPALAVGAVAALVIGLLIYRPWTNPHPASRIAVTKPSPASPPDDALARAIQQGTPPDRPLELAQLVMVLPAPTEKGTPGEPPMGEHIEPLSDMPRAPFMAPKGVKNVALGKPVTSDEAVPFSGKLSQITDGQKEALDEQVVELRKGLHWVQIDLGARYQIYAVAVWHDHRFYGVYRAVIIQVSNDPKFESGVRTLFNNDYANLSGLGAGRDNEYVETAQGRLIDAGGVEARYVRLYSRGSHATALNAYTEVEVYGLLGPN